jgi:hypothetical protein
MFSHHSPFVFTLISDDNISSSPPHKQLIRVEWKEKGTSRTEKHRQFFLVAIE